MDYIKFAKKIAFHAGRVMKKYFRKTNISNYKADRTIVTKADIEINEYLIKMVKKYYPNHSVDGEENSFGKSKYVWVCDPVDGTAMYARGVPVAVFSLALVVDGTSQIGVVYDPWLDNLYEAEKGKGAFKNGKKIHVSDIRIGQKECMANFDMWVGCEFDMVSVLEKLKDSNYFVGVGSVIRAGLLVAEGHFAYAMFPGTKHKNCDIAAINVIIKEAGGKVTDFYGKEQRYDKDINGALMSTGVVHDQVVKVIGSTIKKKEVKNEINTSKHSKK